LLAALLLLLLGARVAEAWHLPLPLCGFKVITGLPCAFCGSTRAAFAAAHLDLTTAVRLNPLACLMGAAVVGAFFAWAADRWFGTRCGRWLRRRSGWPWPWIGLGALLINWLYLLIMAPRG
jgi:hypothetical protein